MANEGLLWIPEWVFFGSKMETAETIAPQEPVEEQVEAQWERAECTCPDWCERDHEQD